MKSSLHAIAASAAIMFLFPVASASAKTIDLKVHIDEGGSRAARPSDGDRWRDSGYRQPRVVYYSRPYYVRQYVPRPYPVYLPTYQVRPEVVYVEE